MAKATSKTQAPSIQIGISDKDRAAIAEGLSRLLADTYTLYLTTHNFHWNVTGPMFNTLHTMFMQQYTELWNAVDPIAERIRSLGHVAPGSYADFGRLASVPDAPAKPPKALEMVRILVEGHEAVARTARSLFPIADKPATNPRPTCSRSASRCMSRRRGCCALCSKNKSASAQARQPRMATEPHTATGQEVELKLALPGGDATQWARELARVPALARHKAQRRQLLSVYYDTPDLRLCAQRAATAPAPRRPTWRPKRRPKRRPPLLPTALPPMPPLPPSAGNGCRRSRPTAAIRR